MAEPFTPEQIEQVRQFTELLSAATRETDPLIKAKIEEAKAADEAKKRLKQMSETIQSSVLSSMGTFSKGLLSTDQGLNKFSGSITGLTGTVGALASQFGFAGKVLGGFIKVMGEIAGASLKQNDDLMKSYQALSDMGSVTAGGLEGLKDQLHRVGLVASEAEKFEKALKPVTSQMAMFGGAVSTGKDKLVSVMEGLIGPNNQFEISLARLGYTTQDIREGAADFVQRQARLGLAQTKSTEQLQKESYKYMTTMKELQELTGMSRDEQQKAMDMQLADARMGIHLRGLKEDEARNLQQYLVLYEQRFGKEAASGLKDRIVNDGKITTELAARSYMVNASGQKDALRAQKQGVTAYAESLNSSADSIKTKVGQLGKNMMFAENGMAELGANSETVNGAFATNRETTESVNKKLKELGDISANGSERLNQNITNEQKMRQMRLMADNALYEVGNLTVGMFTKLIDIGYKFAKFMAQMVDKFSAVIPGMKKTNLSAQFRDIDDVEEDRKKAKWKARESKIEITGARDDMGAALSGKRDVLIKQMEEQERLVSTLKDRANNEKLSEGERAQATIELKMQKRRLAQMDEEYGASRGFRDIQKVQAMRQKRLNDAMAEELKNKEEQDKLDDEEIALAKKTIAGFGTMKANTGVQAVGNQGIATDASGKTVSKEKLAQRQGAASQLSERGKNSEEILKKIAFKNKKENTGGGDVDPALYGLAEKVNELFPGATFTALNDVYHQVKNPNSRHTQGKALDFTLANPPKTPEEADQMKEKLKDIGASKVLDEYFRDKTGSTTGGHFHLEVARNGGLFKGPSNGYPVMLHGKNESVWNEKQMKSLVDDVKKSSIDKYKEELMREFGIDTNSISKTSTASTASLDDQVMAKLYEMMESKLDTLISRMETNNNISDELLTYSKA